MPKLTRLHWLESLLRTEKFGYPGVKFAGIYMVDELDDTDDGKPVFGVFAQYRDHERVNERYPYADGIYISNEMNEGNPLHELCTAGHEIAHWKLGKSGEAYRNSEGHANTYATLFLYEFFSPRLSQNIYAAHRYGEDPCLLAGVKERAVILAKGNERERTVGTKILAYLKRKPRAKAYLSKSAGVSERIASLEKRLAGGGR